MSRYIGNYLRVPSSEPQQSSAPGVWSISEQLNYQRANLWPPARDPYYNQTVLHLSGDVAGTRETNPVTQPRTFLSDASTNNFLLTPNGDVSARPFSPYASSYSNYFTGSATYLTAGVASNWQFLNSGASDYTIEAWVYLYSVSSQQFICATNSAGAAVGMNFQISSGAALILDFTRGVGGSFATFTSTGTLTANAWNHVAVTFATSGKTASFYINGATAGSSSNTGYSYSASNPANTLNIGREPSGTGLVTGYISNLRITNTLVYSGAFTPSAAPLTAVSGTSLLTCQSSRFRDASTNGYTITPSGSPAVSQNSPFVDYDTTSGSGYFDGTSDNLVLPSSSNLAVGTGDFCVEAWVYWTATGVLDAIYSNLANSAGGDTQFNVQLTTGNKVQVSGWSTLFLTGATSVVSNTWNHIAVCRSGTTLSIFLNGTRDATTTSSNNWSSTNAFYIGDYPVGGAAFSGYISNLRVVKGSTPYDPTQTTITVPTAPLTAIPNTQLFTLQTRAPANNQGILDTSPNSLVVTRNGNVAQGSFSPFSAGGWSNFLDGSTAYFTAAANSAINDFGTGDFNIELWFYATSANFATEPSLLSCAVTWATSVAYQFEIRTGGIVYFFAGDSVSININSGATTVSVNTWNHVAASRASGTTRLFVNGTQVSSTNTVATISKSSTAVRIGTFASDGSAGAQKFTGYLSNVRIVKGQALYTGNFTPPTAALTTTSVGTSGANVATSVTGTVGLLTCQSNRFLDQTGKTLTITGSPTVQPFSPFAPTQAYVASQLGGSAYFDGSNDYLSVAQTTQTDLGANNFTLEMWVYFTGLNNSTGVNVTGKWNSTNQWILQYRGPGLDTIANQHWRFYFNSSTGFDFTESSTTSVTTNTWYHIAMVRNGSNWNFYRDGVQIGSTGSSSATVTATSDTLTIGTAQNVANIIQGYISNYRLVIGTALYTSSFPIPTAPPTAVPGTSLLLNFTGAGIVDSTGRNNLETIGNSAVQTTQSRWPPGSMYFDGTGDSLVAPSSQFWTFGSTEDFTIEFWFYTSVTVPISGSTPSTLITNYPDWNTWTNRWAIATNDNKIKWYDHTGNPAIASNNFTYSVWNHVAVVRNSGSIKMYMNGTQEGSTQTTTQTYTTTEKLYVGFVPSGVAFNGYIDDLRITKGYARYVVGTGGNAGQMVFNGTTTLAFPTINTRPFLLA
jgi:hypothetical protein